MLLLVVLGLTPASQAQGLTEDGEIAFTDDVRRWTAYFAGQAIIDVTNRDTQLFGPTVGIGYYIKDNLAANLEFNAYSVEGKVDDPSAWAVTFIGRNHVWDWNYGRSTLFIDVGGGIFEADEPVPAGGTHFNCTFQSGPGITHRMADGVYLMGAVRYYHLSNANRKSDDRNPSINGPLFTLGVMFTF